jgi:hypothetical protein
MIVVTKSGQLACVYANKTYVISSIDTLFGHPIFITKQKI